MCSEGIDTLCNTCPVLWTVRVTVPLGTPVTQVGLKKKSPASIEIWLPDAATVPWIFVLAGSPAEAGHVPTVVAVVATGAGVVEDVLPETPPRPQEVTPSSTTMVRRANRRRYPCVLIRWSPSLQIPPAGAVERARCQSAER